jgi:hypothetical protein
VCGAWSGGIAERAIRTNCVPIARFLDICRLAFAAFVIVPGRFAPVGGLSWMGASDLFTSATALVLERAPAAPAPEAPDELASLFT